MASFKEAGEKLGQFCVACGWHNVTLEVAEIESWKTDSWEDERNVAFALFVQKNEDKDSRDIAAFFDAGASQCVSTEFSDELKAALSACHYEGLDFAGQEE